MSTAKSDPAPGKPKFKITSVDFIPLQFVTTYDPPSPGNVAVAFNDALQSLAPYLAKAKADALAMPEFDADDGKKASDQAFIQLAGFMTVRYREHTGDPKAEIDVNSRYVESSMGVHSSKGSWLGAKAKDAPVQPLKLTVAVSDGKYKVLVDVLASAFLRVAPVKP
jgi:hypothetical protein